MLCNFDEFWIYDFDSAQIDTPLDIVRLTDLPERWGPLAFLFPTSEKPVFGNDHEAITREAADRLPGANPLKDAHAALDAAVLAAYGFSPKTNSSTSTTPSRTASSTANP